MTRTAETAVATAAADWLESGGFEVFEEVQTLYGGRADLVGVSGRMQIIVECKTAWSLDLLHQCARWVDGWHGSQVYACAPQTRDMTAVRRIAKALGVGVLVYRKDFVQEAATIAVLDRAPFRRGRPLPMPEECRRGTGLAAGSVAGGHHTAFRATCDRLRRYVEAHPGCTIADAVTNISHHYATHASARQTLPQRIVDGNVPGVAIRIIDRKPRLFPTQVTP